MPKDWIYSLRKLRRELISLFRGFQKAGPDMSLEFPFEYAETEWLGTLFYPIVYLELKTVDGWRQFSFLVDTGADITTVPSHLLPVLGFDESKLAVGHTLGVDGYSVKTWEFRLPIKIGKTELLVAASAVGTKDDTIPLLLGRKDIFEEKFNLILDSRRKITVISENGMETKREKE